MRHKLPREFVAAHKAALNAWDWGAPLSLAALVPKDAFAFKAEDRLECVNGVVRSAHPMTAVRVRRYAETLPQLPKPTPEEIAAALAVRNPAEAA